MNVVFLVSGGGGNLKYFHQFLLKNNLPIVISGVIADRNCGALEYSEINNIPNFKVKYNKEHIVSLQEVLFQLKPDLIVTNIHKVIDKETLSQYEGKFINLHYSLLPAFSGLIGMSTIAEAKTIQARFIGATCHKVNEVLDGGAILAQCSFPVDWNKPYNLIIDTIFKSACILLTQTILKMLHVNNSGNISEININGEKVQFNPTLDTITEQELIIFESIK